MKACVIFNPTARGDKARRFRDHLTGLGGSVAFKATTTAGHGRVLAAAAVGEGFDTLIAAGGDGTVNEVLNGIGDAPDGFARARLAVLPLGTVNVFARELGLPLALTAAWQVALHGRERTVDLPCVEFMAGGRPQRRYFAQMAGAGLDVRAIELVDWNAKKRVGKLAYVLAGLRALRGPLLSIRCECATGGAGGQQVLIGNGRFYGGPLPVFHRASLTDGLLDACVFPRATLGAALRYGIGYVCGRVFPPGDLAYFQAARFTVSCAEPARFELDGDVAGELPATFSVLPHGLRLVAV